MRVSDLIARSGAAVVALSVSIAGAAAQEDLAGFYRSRTVQVIVPATMGGSFGLYGRLTADSIGRHLPGQPTVIAQSMPAGGGLQSIEYVTRVGPKDGSVIGQILGPSLLVPLMRNTRFDAAQMVWLGSLSTRPGTLAVWHTAAATTLEGARKVELRMGSTGVGAGNFWIPTLANAIIGTRFRLVTGYPGGNEINLAIERGEVDGRFNYWSGWTTVKQDWLAERKLAFLFRTGPKAPDMPNVPALADLVSGDDRQMVRIVDAPDDVGVAFYIASAVPADRRAALLKAFADMVADQRFRAEAARLSAPIEPVSADEVQRVVDSIYTTPPSVIARLKTIIAP